MSTVETSNNTPSADQSQAPSNVDNFDTLNNNQAYSEEINKSTIGDENKSVDM